jgi:hypothetical protein
MVVSDESARYLAARRFMVPSTATPNSAITKANIMASSFWPAGGGLLEES